jgi:hypothetical protein
MRAMDASWDAFTLPVRVKRQTREEGFEEPSIRAGWRVLRDKSGVMIAMFEDCFLNPFL